MEDSGGAGADGEDAQELVEGVADGPGLHVGAEVAGSALACAAHHLGAGELLAERDHEVGVGLVVLVHDVEARVELLDPGVLQGEGLHLGGHDGPLDGAGGGDHLLSAGVEGGEILEVVAQARAEVLGLADVDDAALGVEEAVDAGRRGDLACGGAVRRGVCHGWCLTPIARGRTEKPGPRGPGGGCEWAILGSNQ